MSTFWSRSSPLKVLACWFPAVGIRKSSRNWILHGCSAIAIAIALSRTAYAQQVYVQDFVKSTVTPETVWQPALTAGFSNWVSQPTGFGSGWNGYGYHYGVATAGNVNGKFMRKFAFAAVSRHEDEFSPIQTGDKWKRIGQALEHSIFVSPGATSKNFNWSGLPASLASAALSNAYQPPEQRSVIATFSRFGTNCDGYAAGDIRSQVLQIVKKHPALCRALTNR